MREGDSRLLYREIKIYGEENFKMEIIDTCYDRHRFIIEEYYTQKYFNEGHPLYNEGKFGNRLTPNTRQRIIEIRKSTGNEIYQTEEFRDKISNLVTGENNPMFGKVDNMAVNGRCVIAYFDKDCTKIAHTFVSVKMALDFIGVKGHTKLNVACRSNEEYKGFYWKKEWKKYHNEG